jgi:putative flippase GtrA
LRSVPEKLARYVCTGGLAAIVDLGGFVLLARFGWPLVVAAAASFLVAMLFHYVAASRIVFAHALSWSRFTSFALASLLGLAANTGVTSAAAYLFALTPAWSKVLGIGAAFAVNFSVNLLVTFRERH